MSRRRVLGCVTGLFVVAVVAAPAAVGGKPTFERIPISESEPDDFLSDACGVDVTTRAEGHIIHRGRTVATSEGALKDCAGKLYAHATTTCMIFPAKR